MHKLLLFFIAIAGITCSPFMNYFRFGSGCCCGGYNLCNNANYVCDENTLCPCKDKTNITFVCPEKKETCDLKTPIVAYGCNDDSDCGQNMPHIKCCEDACFTFTVCKFAKTKKNETKEKEKEPAVN